MPKSLEPGTETSLAALALSVNMEEGACMILHGGSAVGEGSGTFPLTRDDDLAVFIDVAPQAVCCLNGCHVFAERIDTFPLAGDDQRSSLINETVCTLLVSHPSAFAVETPCFSPLAGNNDVAVCVGKAYKSILFNRLQSHYYLMCDVAG